ncbi:SBP (S-ribonuclease binding protein) family protein [Arabidopsis thaliana]|uniref:SBP (S-ribonuclease binding protein) family protein n=1 Tax=Arabidopsis thaliana TaxID=3702 RepID=Q8LCK5_ARATH|nr:SBP (S-ribonuclease binding protein) family protein [Arabidopsis thaliana]AAM63608.1 unknown [Arabidopsis thaliana]AEE31523.1 SBP (S-ribonuclease binding protein) family protein [Arabidopsis thaliana]|eukprot:NP_564408.1 SBP (S-ribonuclease binding protein) family protein [Arabidopsis thaliana]
MAVQAQHHSSNLLFLNKRNGKEKEHSNFTLQSQAAGDFLDQTNMLFNNGSSNQRKRRRETNNHQLLPMQSHQFPQVIDLSLLHNYNHPPSNMVHTGLRLFSGEDQAQKISHLSEDVFAAHINRQSEELDEFLHAQAEELRRTLAEKRKMHYKALLGAVEESLVRKLREKEVEIERATRRHNELVARDSQLRAEVQVWQERAKAHEDAAASLQSQLQQAVNQCAGGCVSAQDSRAAEEGLLCTTISGVDDAESVYVDPERVKRPNCKACREREATVVVLPCRHLSICPGCDRTALACPLCLTLRNSSVEAIFC